MSSEEEEDDHNTINMSFAENTRSIGKIREESVEHEFNNREDSRGGGSEGLWLTNENYVNEGLHVPPFKKKKIIKAYGNANNCQYVYWNDVNELVQRLYLLHMSKQAGNLSVVNEILNIEEELREGGYIK